MDIRNPGHSVFLPPGRYLFQVVDFPAGLSVRTDIDFVLTPEKPYRLDIGASVKPRVTVKREGRLLKLEYELLDAGGLDRVKPIS